MTIINKVAVLGAGVIGAGWIARFAENGIAVALFDPAPDARAKVEAVLWKDADCTSAWSIRNLNL